MGTYRYEVPNLCPCHAPDLQNTLSQQLKVQVYVCPINKQVEIEDEDAFSIERHRTYFRAIKAAGQSPNWFPHWVKAIIGLVLGAACLILCLLPIPFIAMLVIGIISSGLTIALGYESFLSAYRASYKLNMDSLFVVSALLAIVVSVAALFIPGLPMMFELGLLVFGFRQLGLAIEKAMLKKIKVVSFQDLVPKRVMCFRENIWQEVLVEKVEIGEKIQVKEGETVPLDGTVLEEVWGTETHKTGQIQARCFKKDSEISAGTCVVGKGEIQVTKLHQNSYLMVMHRALQSAIRSESPLKVKIDKALRFFVPAIFVLAIISGIVVGCLVGLLPGLSCAIAVLVCACPCVLGLVSSLMCSIGVGKAAEAGMVLRSHEALERAKDIDMLMIDLHGTLTDGNPRAVITYACREDEQNYYAALMAAMESAALTQKIEKKKSCSKAIAQAILEALRHCERSEAIHKDLQVNIEQGGLSAIYQGKTYYLGDATLMQAKGIEIPKDQSGLWLVEDKVIRATIAIYDRLRPGAKETLRQLRAQGIGLRICTGAPEATAKYFARQLGIEDDACIFACLPEGKVAAMKQLQDQGKRVAMLGDGNNDGLVMKKADLSIAVISEFTGKVAEGEAMVHIPHKQLQALPKLFAIAKETLTGIYIGLGVNVSYNVLSVILAGGVLLAAGILMPPVVGAIFMFVQVCAVLAGAYYMKQREVKLPRVEGMPAEEVMGELGSVSSDTPLPRPSPQRGEGGSALIGPSPKSEGERYRNTISSQEKVEGGEDSFEGVMNVSFGNTP